ncbi:MAG: hypothetical protein IT330_10740 [Anaerolineae bacterium]|nr:hypothetical protein [Anaerolineae bacterium]
MKRFILLFAMLMAILFVRAVQTANETGAEPLLAAPADVLPITPVAVSVAAGRQVNPAVAFEGQGDQFLVVWADARDGVNWHIYGQRLSAFAYLISENFWIASTAITVGQAAPYPRIAWNSADNEFLVAWKSTANGGVVYGQRLNPEGGVVGGLLQLSPTNIDTSYNHQRLGLAYNPDDNQYLLTWADERYGPKAMVQRLTNAGARIGTESFACSACGGISQRNPAVVYNATAQEYFLAWQELISNGIEIVGQRLSRTVVPLTSGIQIAVASGSQTLPDASYNVATNLYSVVWRDERAGGGRRVVWGRGVKPDGGFQTNQMAMTTAFTEQYGPAVEWHSGNTIGYLLLWSDTRNYGGTSAASSADLMARWLDGTGVPYGSEYYVAQGYGASNPDLIYSAKWVRYLMTWQDGRNDPDGQTPWEYDIYAARYFTGPGPTPTFTPTPTRTPTATPSPTPSMITPTFTPRPTSTMARVEGVVFHDRDGNGSRGAGEPGLGGALVEVYTYPAGEWVGAFTTLGDGQYWFDLPPSTYRIQETRAPAGYILSPPYAAPLIQTLVAGMRVTWNFPNVQPTITPTPLAMRQRGYVPMLLRGAIPTPTPTPTPQSDPYEPNDGFGDAKGPMSSGVVLYGLFPPPTDEEDFYYFDLDGPSAIKAWLWNIPVGSDYNLVLYNAPESAGQIGYSGEPGNTMEHISVQGQSGGRYYVRVYRVSGPPTLARYSLCLEFGEGGPRCPALTPDVRQVVR